VAEVALDGDLKYGVNWFFDNAVAGRALTGPGGVTLPAAQVARGAASPVPHR
jgi:general secretion pathway protein D